MAAGIVLPGGGWTFYTPYSPGRQIAEILVYADRLLFPVATLSLAMYLLLLDRDVRLGSPL